MPEDDDEVETDISDESDETSWADESSRQDEDHYVDEPSTSLASKPNNLTLANFIMVCE